MTSPLITFASDFGAQDWFVAVVHGVIHEICPEAKVVDLSHRIEPGDIGRAAFLLEAAADDFAPGTIHLAVVDPGVGTERRALAVRARGQIFVGPDNGILEWALGAPDPVVHVLVEERWFRQPVSRTFHGRDVFAPVAAHLARGVPLDSFGPRIEDAVRRSNAPVRSSDGALVGAIAYVDHFGNALTNIQTHALRAAFPGMPEDAFEIEIGGRQIAGIARSYGDAPIGTLMALLGSSNRLEIAQVGGHAASRFGFGSGDPVVIRRRSG